MNTVEKYFYRFAEVLFFCLSLWIVLVKAQVTFEDVPLLLLAVIFVAAIAMAIRFDAIVQWGRLRFSGSLDGLAAWIERQSHARLMLVLFVLSMGTKLLITFLFEIDYTQHTDFGTYYSFICQLVDGGTITSSAAYALRHPYTTVFSMLFVPVGKIFGISVTTFTVTMCLMHSVSSLLIYDVMRQYSSKTSAFIAMMVWIFPPTGMFQQQLLVHENGLLFFHILGIWMLFRVLPKRKTKMGKCGCFFLACLIMAYAAHINKMGLIAMCAVCIILHMKKKGKCIEKVVVAILACAVMVLCYVGVDCAVNGILEQIVDAPDAVNEEYRVPYAWSVYVGANYESGGHYDQADAEIFLKFYEMSSAEEAREYQINLLTERFQEYIRSPQRIILHMNDKMQEIWGETFEPLAYGYGNQLNDFLETWQNGLLLRLYLRCNYLLSLIMAAVVALSFSGKEIQGEKADLFFYIKLFLIGMTMILLCTEVTPKYSSHMLPLFIVLFVNRIKPCCRNMRRFSRWATGISQKNCLLR